MRTRQKQCVATDTWRSLGCRTTPLELWSKRKPTVEVVFQTQYEFLYDAIVEWMTVGKSRISAVEGSHYFCGLLKCENEYSELSDKQHEVCMKVLR